MFKSKKVLIILVTVVLFVFCLTWLCACKQKDKKYDVTFIITYEQVDEYCNRNYGEILGRWTVPPDVDVLDIELSKFEQGKYYEIFVYAFQIADHPVLGDIWFHDNYSSAWDSREPPLYYLFSCGAYGLKQENVSGTSYYNIIEKPGYYISTISAMDDSPLWNPRDLELHIFVPNPDANNNV